MAEHLFPDVAIVGGGPAGLGAAIELKKRGVGQVMVLERESEAGGIPRHCARPPYGLREFRRLMSGPEYARRLRALAIDGAVDIRLRHSVVALEPEARLSVATPAGALTVNARRVVLAMGARERPRSARLLSGDRPTGILNTGALQGCLYLKSLRPFRSPIIVGTELVSLSAIWTCLRHGIRPAAIIENETRATARWPLGLFPQLVGIPLHLNSRLTQISGIRGVESVEITADDGRRSRIACDGVLLTGEFVPEAALLHAGGIEWDPGSGGPLIDQFGRCSDAAYFAAGNVLRPVETAGWCYREGVRIGSIVADDLAGRLAAVGDTLRVERGAGLKLVVPQRLARVGGPKGLSDLQLRASRSIEGRLTLRSSGELL